MVMMMLDDVMEDVCLLCDCGVCVVELWVLFESVLWVCVELLMV